MPVNSFENYPMAWKPERVSLTKPWYRSLAEKLEADIRSGALPENTKLPPQRELADFLDLNLSTVTRAYKACELKGLIYGVTGSGTFVSPGVLESDTFLEKGGEVIEMGMIRPFYECNQEILTAAQKTLARRGAVKLMEYGEPLGSRRQLLAAVKWMNAFGIPAMPACILPAAGAQNALSVALVSLFEAGDKIAVDAFTYTNFRGLANFLHIQLIALEADEDGMLPEALKSACIWQQLKGVYLMPTCSNPTGIFMPEKRRRELAEIVTAHGLVVIEDDIYSFLMPGRAPSFLTLAPENTVHICSVSKALGAGLRTAFLAFPPSYREALTAGLLHINLKPAALNTEIVAELIESMRAFEIAERKRQLAEDRNRIYDQILGEGETKKDARFFRWLKLPAGLTGESFEVLALKRGVRVLGSHRFAMLNQEKSSYVRLAVVSPDPQEELEGALWRLKEILEGNGREFFV